MSELKPCPFCGSDEIKYKFIYSCGDESYVGIKCLKCGCTVPINEFGKHIKEPYAKWNHRADKYNMEDILEILDKMIENAKRTNEYIIGDGLTIKRDGLSESDAIHYATWIKEVLEIEQ